jgi:hypothetical protein
MSEVEKIEKLTEGLKKYVNTNYELGKLELTERVSVIGASVISNLLIGTACFFCLFFLSIAGGFYISAHLNNNYAGFVIVAAFYLLLGLVLILVRKKYMNTSFRDKIIWQIFSKSNQE